MPDEYYDEDTPQSQSILPSTVERPQLADGPLEEASTEVVSIADLPTEVQDMVLDHLVQAGSIPQDEAELELVRARGQLSKHDLQKIT